jgi:hypothetical protein
MKFEIPTDGESDSLRRKIEEMAEKVVAEHEEQQQEYRKAMKCERTTEGLRLQLPDGTWTTEAEIQRQEFERRAAESARLQAEWDAAQVNGRFEYTVAINAAWDSRLSSREDVKNLLLDDLREVVEDTFYEEYVDIQPVRG